MPRVYRSLWKVFKYFSFSELGSHLCHFHLCVAEGIFANAAKVPAISQRDAASLYTHCCYFGDSQVYRLYHHYRPVKSQREKRVGGVLPEALKPLSTHPTGTCPGGPGWVWAWSCVRPCKQPCPQH